MNAPQRKGRHVDRLIELPARREERPVPSQGHSPALLTVEMAAERLGITRTRAYRWVRSGRLYAIQDERPWMVPIGEIERLGRETNGPRIDPQIRGETGRTLADSAGVYGPGDR